MGLILRISKSEVWELHLEESQETNPLCMGGLTQLVV